MHPYVGDTLSKIKCRYVVGHWNAADRCFAIGLTDALDRSDGESADGVPLTKDTNVMRCV